MAYLLLIFFQLYTTRPTTFEYTCTLCVCVVVARTKQENKNINKSSPKIRRPFTSGLGEICFVNDADR
jgi:hypothetical protein